MVSDLSKSIKILPFSFSFFSAFVVFFLVPVKMPVITLAMTRAMKDPNAESNKGTTAKLDYQVQSDTSDDLSDEWKIVSVQKKKD